MGKSETNWGWKKVLTIISILAALGSMALVMSSLVVAPVQVQADNNSNNIKAHCSNDQIHTPGQQWRTEIDALQKQMEIQNQNWNIVIDIVRDSIKNQ